MGGGTHVCEMGNDMESCQILNKVLRNLSFCVVFVLYFLKIELFYTWYGELVHFGSTCS